MQASAGHSDPTSHDLTPSYERMRYTYFHVHVRMSTPWLSASRAQRRVAVRRWHHLGCDCGVSKDHAACATTVMLTC